MITRGEKMNRKIKREGQYWVYMVECRDGSYYTGYTNNVEKRIAEHNGTSRGAKYLMGKGPVTLVYAKEYKYYKNAVKREREIKTLTRAEKQDLISIYEKSKDIA